MITVNDNNGDNNSNDNEYYVDKDNKELHLIV